MLSPRRVKEMMKGDQEEKEKVKEGLEGARKSNRGRQSEKNWEQKFSSSKIVAFWELIKAQRPSSHSNDDMRQREKKNVDLRRKWISPQEVGRGYAFQTTTRS